MLSFGTCSKCKKPVTNPLTHVCAPRSDFRRRKAAYEKKQRARTRKKRQQEAHDYTECSDKDCPRSLCVAYKKGWKAGDEHGFDRGWQQCYPVAYAEGVANCPRQHV